MSDASVMREWNKGVIKRKHIVIVRKKSNSILSFNSRFVLIADLYHYLNNIIIFQRKVC